MQFFRLDEPAPRRIEVEELRVPPPVDRGLQLPQRLFFAELLVQHVVEELLRHDSVALRLDRAHDLSQQQHVVDSRLAEELLLAQNLRVRVLCPGRCDRRVTFGDRQKAQQLRRVHNRQQVVDLEGQIVSQPIDVVLAIVVEQQLQQACDASRTCMRKHLIMHRPLIANRLSRWCLRERRRLGIRLRQHLVDVVHQLSECRHSCDHADAESPP